MSSRIFNPRFSAFARIGLFLAACPVLCHAEPPSKEPAKKTAEVKIGLATAGVTAEAGGGVWGVSVLGTAGVQAQELKTSQDRRFVWQLNGGAQLVDGIVANQHPTNSAHGGRLQLGGLFGARYTPQSNHSLFIGVGAQGEGHALTLKGVPYSQTNTVNNLGQLGGIAGTLKVRGYVGDYFLKNDKALLLALYSQQELDSALTNTPGRTPYGGGILAKYDTHGFSTHLDLSLVTTGQMDNPNLGQELSATRWALDGGFTKTFWKDRLYTGAYVDVSREQDTLTSNGSQFKTNEPVTEFVGLSFGANIGKLVGIE